MSEFAQTLRTWRATRRYSQLDLALVADISARHLSFLETGRARPSREMVVRLGEALELPLEARNHLMTEAGFAVRYQCRDWDDAPMVPIRRAVARQLDRHSPYPGLVLDRRWTILGLNPTARKLFGALGLGPGDSILDLMTSPILPQAVENWPEVAHHAAARLRTESAARGGVPEFEAVIRHLSEVPQPKQVATSAVVPTTIRLGETRLSMFATISQFGTPEDLLLDDLKVELYFPLDEATEAVFRMMDERHASPDETGGREGKDVFGVFPEKP